MTEQAEVVESTMQAAVDAAAQEQVAVPKTFTEAEVDAKIKQRIDKQNAKHAYEIEALQQQLKAMEERAVSAESSRDDLQRKSELAASREAIASELGVPASIIRGETIDEMREHAEAIKAAIPTAPVIIDSGEQKQPPNSSLAIFDKFMNENF